MSVFWCLENILPKIREEHRQRLQVSDGFVFVQLMNIIITNCWLPKHLTVISTFGLFVYPALNILFFSTNMYRSIGRACYWNTMS